MKIEFDEGTAIIRVENLDRELAEARVKELRAAADIDPRETVVSAELGIMAAVSPKLPAVSETLLRDYAVWLLAARIAIQQVESESHPPVLVGPQWNPEQN